MSEKEILTPDREDAVVNDEDEGVRGKYLTFWCRSQLFGVGISRVVQIVQGPEVTPMPESPAYMKGIVCIRGEVIPVVDMQMRLGGIETPYDESTCVVIVTMGEQSFGLVVDGVDAVEDFPDDEILPPPQTAAGRTNYLTGIVQRKNVTLLLDMDLLLSTEEILTMLNDKSVFTPEA